MATRKRSQSPDSLSKTPKVILTNSHTTMNPKILYSRNQREEHSLLPSYRQGNPNLVSVTDYEGHVPLYPPHSTKLDISIEYTTRHSPGMEALKEEKEKEVIASNNVLVALTITGDPLVKGSSLDHTPQHTREKVASITIERGYSNELPAATPGAAVEINIRPNLFNSLGMTSSPIVVLPHPHTPPPSYESVMSNI